MTYYIGSNGHDMYYVDVEVDNLNEYYDVMFYDGKGNNWWEDLGYVDRTGTHRLIYDKTLGTFEWKAPEWLATPDEPVTDTEVPATDTEENVTDTEAPATDTDEPVTDTEAPATDTEENVTDTEAPATDTDEYVTDTEAPVTDTDEYVTDTEVPSTDTEEPTTDEPTTDEPSTDEPSTDEPIHDTPDEPTYADIEYQIGDIDLDGKANSHDSLMALRNSVELGDAFSDVQFTLADIDGDGVITAADSLAILRHSAKYMTLGKITLKIRVS